MLVTLYAGVTCCNCRTVLKNERNGVATAYLLVTSTSALAELLQLGGASVVRAGRPGSGERRTGRSGAPGSGEPRSGPGRLESDGASHARGGAAGLRRVADRAGVAGIWRHEPPSGRGRAAGLRRAMVGAGATGIRRRKPRSRRGGVESGGTGWSPAGWGGASRAQAAAFGRRRCGREIRDQERDAFGG